MSNLPEKLPQNLQSMQSVIDELYYTKTTATNRIDQLLDLYAKPGELGYIRPLPTNLLPEFIAALTEALLPATAAEFAAFLDECIAVGPGRYQKDEGQDTWTRIIGRQFRGRSYRILQRALDSILRNPGEYYTADKFLPTLHERVERLEYRYKRLLKEANYDLLRHQAQQIENGQAES